VTGEEKRMDDRGVDRMVRWMTGAIGSRRALLATPVAGAVARLLGPGPAAAKTAVTDARCPAPRGKPQGFERDVVAQTFQAKHSGVLVSATVWFTDLDSSGTDDFWVALHTVDRKGRPTARVLAEAPLTDLVDPPTGQTTPATADFTGPLATLGPATVKKGKRYALLVRFRPILQVNVNGRCDGSLFGFDGATGEWERIPFSGGLVFTTRVQPA
jgi:hypothetical protein